MSTIAIRAEELRSANNSLNEVVNNLNGLFDRISHIAADMKETWDGAACDEYISRLTMQNQRLKEVIKIIEEFGSYAGDSAEVFEALDEWFKQIPIFGGVIEK